MNLPKDINLKVAKVHPAISENSSLNKLKAKLKASELSSVEYGAVSIEGSSAYNNSILINSITYQKNDGSFYSIVEINSSLGSGYLKISFIQDGDNVKLTSSEELDENLNPIDPNLKNWGQRYTRCLNGMLQDDLLGPFFAVSGLASGFGCVACGVAAGFVFGVGAVGCLAA